MKQVLFLLGLIFLINFNGDCQSWGDSTIKNGPVFYSVEEAPKFPGGIEGYYKFLSDNLKMPANPFSETSNRIVAVRIYIDKKGRVVFAEIDHGVNKNYNDVVLELIKKMPAWLPGIQNGHAVPATIIIPILFVD